MDPQVSRRYREAVVTYYDTAHRPYREVIARAAPLRARVLTDVSDAHLQVEDVVNDSLRLLVLGPPGSGKTTSLDRVAHDFAATGRRTPIFVPLRRYVTTLPEAIQEQIRRFIPNASLDDLRDHSGKEIALLLDGYDEVAPPLVERATADILSLAAQLPSAQIIVTARSGSVVRLTAEWKQVELLPLSNAEVRQALERVAGPDVIEQVFAHPQLLDIARRPLFLHTIANAAGTVGDLRQYILDAATGYLVWRGHSKSTLPVDVPVEAIGRALEVLAMEVVRGGALWLKRGTAESLLAADEALRLWNVTPAVFDTDVLDATPDEVRFTHISYVEAYAAKYLRSSLRAGGITASDLHVSIESRHAAGILSSLFKLLSAGERTNFLDQLTTPMLATVMRVASREVAEHIRSAPSSMPERSQMVVDALEAAQRIEQRGNSRRDVIVFAIHGFNTRGAWKNWLSTLLNMETDGVRFIYAPWDYGVFRLGILNPLARRKKVSDFQLYFNSVLDAYGATRPDVCAVAHSFGTYIVGKSLLLFDEIRFDRIILVRSVLPRTYPWNKIATKCSSVLNECGGADAALLAAQLVPGLGASGRFGFKAATATVKENLNEFGEHSTVFGSRYMREKWIPFLREGML